MQVYSWGRGEDGQLGLGDTNDQDEPQLMDALRGKVVKQIACGSGHTVVLVEDGEVYTWGRGDDGRLGHGDNGWKYVPRLVEKLQRYCITQITCGSYHTAAVTDSGQLFTWGGGMYGKLGHGDEAGHATPALVEALRASKVAQVACGSRHTVALLSTGRVLAWGDRENGVCGHGPDAAEGAPMSRPHAVAGLGAQVCSQISACGFHSAALCEGRVYTWGEGKFGRLGHGNERNAPVPLAVEGLAEHRIVQVSCGGFHTAAITETGLLFTWGGGEHGQLGHGDKVNSLLPTPVAALAGPDPSSRRSLAPRAAPAAPTGTAAGAEVLPVLPGAPVQAAAGPALPLPPGLPSAASERVREGRRAEAPSAEGAVRSAGATTGQERSAAAGGEVIEQQREGAGGARARRPGGGVVVTQITCGWSHTVVLTGGGEVYTWGNGDHGKLGHGGSHKVTMPTRVEALRGVEVLGIASYNEHTAALARLPPDTPCGVMTTAAYLQNMHELLRDSAFADVVFLLGEERVPAHRAILSARSAHFRAMFSSGMRESQEEEVRIPSIRPHIFRAMLEYIYTDTVEITADIAIELYEAADLYALDSLKNRCEHVLERQISVDNAAALLQVSDELGATALKDICVTFIVRHFDACTQASTFRELVLSGDAGELVMAILDQRMKHGEEPPREPRAET